MYTQCLESYGAVFKLSCFVNNEFQEHEWNRNCKIWLVLSVKFNVRPIYHCAHISSVGLAGSALSLVNNSKWSMTLTFTLYSTSLTEVTSVRIQYSMVHILKWTKYKIFSTNPQHFIQTIKNNFWTRTCGSIKFRYCFTVLFSVSLNTQGCHMSRNCVCMSKWENSEKVDWSMRYHFHLQTLIDTFTHKTT